MDEQRTRTGARRWRRVLGVGALGGLIVATAGCFLPNTGRLAVVVGEEFFSEGPPSFTFEKDTYSVPRGQIDVSLIAPTGSAVPHNLHIEGEQAPFLDLPGSSDAAETTIELGPGTYVLICSLPNHAALGMVADLIVL